MAIARAERRPVAIVNLTETDAGMELARALGNEVNQHAVLGPIDAVLAGELMSKAGPDDQTRRLRDAHDAIRAAEQQLERFEFKSAEGTVQAAQSALLSATPTGEVVATYAELSFLLGHAYLGLRDNRQAAAAFALAHRVDPTFQPDEGRYLPEVIRTYNATKAGQTATGTISVTGTGTVVIDNQEVGTAPAWFPATAGDHVVWLIGPDRDPRGKKVTVAAKQKEEVAIEDAVTTKRTKVSRARNVLRAAPDTAARSTAMGELATLLGIKDAVLVTDNAGKLVVQTWSAADGFSKLRERKTEPVAELLWPLAPPPPAKIARKDDRPIKLPPPEDRWYEKSRYRIGIPSAVLAIVGIFVIASIDRHVTTNGNLGPKPTETIGR
ncbi:MAG TPA: hypothetical protein VFQ53_41805 [Kofleriaceae bacterium]|nr:hypothetical protein [Kofleriaceae bacterium]